MARKIRLAMNVTANKLVLKIPQLELIFDIGHSYEPLNWEMGNIQHQIFAVKFKSDKLPF